MSDLISLTFPIERNGELHDLLGKHVRYRGGTYTVVGVDIRQPPDVVVVDLLPNRPQDGEEIRELPDRS